MHRINTDTAVPDLFGPGKSGFSDSIPTQLNGLFFNALQEEVLAVIEAEGFAPTPAVHDQLNTAIERKVDRKLAVALGDAAPDLAFFVNALG